MPHDYGSTVKGDQIQLEGPMELSKINFLLEIRRTVIDTTIDHSIYTSFVDYLGVTDHYIRFCNTLRSMLNFGLELREISVCETGTLSPIALFLRDCGCTVT
jgi:hypothetical protein